MGWWLRHRPGSEDVTGAVTWVSVQSTLVFWFNKNCTSRGSWGPSTSWDPWPRPVTHEAWGTQECTQIGGNGLLASFWGICVHCCDSRGSCASQVGAQECTQIGGNGLSELFWGICVHCCDSRGSRASGAAARLAFLPR